MSKRLIKFYKGIVLENLHTHLVQNGTMISIDELDSLLKSISSLDKSTTKMTTDELNELIIDAFIPKEKEIVRANFTEIGMNNNFDDCPF